MNGPEREQLSDSFNTIAQRITHTYHRIRNHSENWREGGDSKDFDPPFTRRSMWDTVTKEGGGIKSYSSTPITMAANRVTQHTKIKAMNFPLSSEE
ncbi:hypothetical protein CEXT_771221 [Caerostris extrusa]|uniref:Uncharacterized protein n=1 Tax=Caerostris extrusa TaxID=172846 RepID=A0AAV4PN31_CAEEX|nr:hypothetical protein CEXT_771221 [Caerostris extrusa]